MLSNEERKRRNNEASKRSQARKKAFLEGPAEQTIPRYAPGMAKMRENIEKSVVKLSQSMAKNGYLGKIAKQPVDLDDEPLPDIPFPTD